MQKNKHREIALEIRRSIFSGRLKPEDQLPTRTELEREFKVSRVTMQNAIDALVRDGTVYARGTSGTFVSKSPDELYHYGLVFHHKPGYDLPWSRQWKVILQEAEKLFSEPAYRLSVFYGDRYYLNANGNADFIDDIRNRRMAGLILTMPPEMFDGTEILGHREIPKVTLKLGADKLFPHVEQDSGDMLKRIVKYLSGRNRSKTSLLMYSRMVNEPGYVDKAVNLLKGHGLETRDYWIQGADILHPESVRNIVSLMMLDKGNRPDSIMILDDNLIPGVIEGLIASDVRIPEDVELVSMVNFPYQEKLAAPVKMFGYDIPEQLRIAKLKLDTIRQGLTYEKATYIKYLSDVEYADKTGNKT